KPSIEVITCEIANTLVFFAIVWMVLIVLLLFNHRLAQILRIYSFPLQKPLLKANLRSLNQQHRPFCVSFFID
ncbi:MAG: hypothetical protein U9R43_12300, partial [Thermodesulfobacteriota bacterium]|nr:hypothetical protein [Thermodesulfobacteriota bacterium]